MRPPCTQKSALLTFRFLAVTLIGSLVMALVSAFGPLPAQIAILGALVCALAGLFVSYLEQEDKREARREEALARLNVPLALAADPDLYAQYVTFSSALNQLASQPDPIVREIALLKLMSVNEQITSLASGTVVFAGTEAWRTVYDQLLRSPDLPEYFSVAWVRSKHYWRDLPGQKSMQANFDAVQEGLPIERTLILADELWPKKDLLPLGEILPWIEKQHNQGIWVKLVRESELASEPELKADFGIYGERAVGTQELDESSRTIRFILQFDPQAIRLAKERWERLGVYSVSFSKVLDRLDGSR